MNVMIALSSRSQQAIFLCPSDYFEFLRIMIEAKRSYASAVYAFCLMPDYCRIAARFEDGAKVREFIRYLNRTYRGHVVTGNTINDLRIKNHMPCVLEGPAELLHAVQWIEREPVSAGIVASAQEYPYGSAYYRASRKNVFEKVY